MYTLQHYAPPEMQVYEYGEDAGSIYVEDFAHLTMINVTVVPWAYISVCDNAFLEIINCTNYDNGWYVNGSEANVYRLQPQGEIAASENSTVLVERSKIGFLSVDWGSWVNCTVVDSFVDRASLKNRIPLNFVDSEVYEMYDPFGNVDLVGTSKVAYRGYPWKGARIALELSASLEKTDFMLEEPISMTCQLYNVGELNVTLFLSDGTDHFFLCVYKQPISENTTFHYFNRKPIQGPHTPTVVMPGETLEQTLVWQNLPLLPGTYRIIGNLESPTLYDSLHMCGSYTITISS